MGIYVFAYTIRVAQFILLLAIIIYPFVLLSRKLIVADGKNVLMVGSLMRVLCLFAIGALIFYPVYHITMLIGGYAFPGLWNIPYISFFRAPWVSLTASQTAVLIISHSVAVLLSFVIVWRYCMGIRVGFLQEKRGVVSVKEAFSYYVSKYAAYDCIALIIVIALMEIAAFLFPQSEIVNKFCAFPLAFIKEFGIVFGNLIIVLISAQCLAISVLNGVYRWRTYVISKTLRG